MFASPGPGDLNDICHSHALTKPGADSCWMSGQVWPPYHAPLPHTATAASPELATPHPLTYPPTHQGRAASNPDEAPFLLHIGKWAFGHFGLSCGFSLSVSLGFLPWGTWNISQNGTVPPTPCFPA